MKNNCKIRQRTFHCRGNPVYKSNTINLPRANNGFLYNNALSEACVPYTCVPNSLNSPNSALYGCEIAYPNNTHTNPQVFHENPFFPAQRKPRLLHKHAVAFLARFFNVFLPRHCTMRKTHAVID